ncbi:hypothetical protein RRG08_052918 [Elysia crispata]|uniref:Uncharacterized protein n=1 Tax=Elysia crispata TaxID=231223 RepID=A0AAE0Z3Y0_9GAST|nr:hypothetical protein RRG08_052918 [Elysia crispata]
MFRVASAVLTVTRRKTCELFLHSFSSEPGHIGKLDRSSWRRIEVSSLKACPFLVELFQLSQLAPRDIEVFVYESLPFPGGIVPTEPVGTA